MTGRPTTWMPLYIGDYLKDTTHLGALESGAYLHLIMQYWSTGKPLPDVDRMLWRVAKADSIDQWTDEIRPMLEPFFSIKSGKWHHKRIDAEIQKATGMAEARAEAGRKGAQKRWQTDGGANGGASGKAISEPIANAKQNDAPSQPPSQSQLPSRPKKALNGFEGKAGQPDIPLPDDFAPSERSMDYFRLKLGHDPPLVARILTRLRELSARGEVRRDWDEAFRWQVDRLAERKPVKSVGAALSGAMRH